MGKIMPGEWLKKKEGNGWLTKFLSCQLETHTLLRRNLLSLLKKNGILRINKEALNSLEKHIYKYLVKNIPKLKENMEINGRKTLKGEDVFILDEQKRE